jgi:thiol-disulfide isomerase/thioredoxin
MSGRSVDDVVASAQNKKAHPSTYIGETSLNTVTICKPGIGRLSEVASLSCCLKIIFAAIIFAFQASACLAAALNDIDAVPHLESAGKQGYREFLAAGKHRAFAIAPGGVWFWKAGEESAESAAENALQACLEERGISCTLYAVDDRIVFDEKAWLKLWGPYQTKAMAARAYTGKERGDRFYNLTFRNASGKLMKLSELKGKVVLLHFWGSWCPSCLREMPELQQLHRALGASPDIQMVLLQVREKFATGRQWAQTKNLDLPLHDSAVTGSALDMMKSADGKSIHDRDIATAFPTSYVIDKHGIVVFSHVGPVSGWLQYLQLLRDVAERSGK